MSRARSALPLALALLLASSLARGQEAPSPHDVPAGDGRIRVRVVHESRPTAVADVEVVLYALPPDGAPGLRHAETDAGGLAVFEGLGTDPAIAYLVGARFAEVPYPGARVRFEPGQSEAEVEVRVVDVTSTGHVDVREHRIALAAQGTSLALQEALRVQNPGAETLFVAAAQRSGARPFLEIELPAGASGFEVPFGLVPEGLVQDGERVRWWGPLYPGEQTLEFGYRVPLPAEERVTLQRVLPAGAERVVLRVPEQGLELEAPGFAPEEATDEPGWRALTRAGLAPGSRIELALRLPPARRDPSAVSLAEVRLVVDPDAAALRVREEYVLRVEGDSPVVAPPGGRLARISLPPDAQNLRFGGSLAGLGLTPEAEGGLGVLGPLPPGETRIELVYLLPRDGSETQLARAFDRALPLLSIYVADTGRLALRSDRLHRRRPAATPDRTYAHFEAFEVAAGETVALRIASLPPRRALPAWARLGGLVLLAAGAVGLLLAPLRNAGDRMPETPEESADAREREAVYAALRDLEHDHETGKVEDEAYARLREELRARALASLRAERDAGRAASAAAPSATCPACGVEPRPGDRFCARCGSALAPAAEREARA